MLLVIYLTRSGFDLVSFDFWGEYFCGSESCKNLERCSIQWSNTNQISSTIKSKYVIFRGIYFKPELKCECPHRFHGTKCDKPFNMCFMERCNSNGKCVSTDDGFSCKCDHGYTGKWPDLRLFPLKIILRFIRNRLVTFIYNSQFNHSKSCPTCDSSAKSFYRVNFPINGQSLKTRTKFIPHF